MTASATVDDLDWLLRTLRDQLPALVEHSAARSLDLRARLGRCEDFLVTAIDVRRAQQTRSKTPHHQQLMEAYYAAVAAWKAAEEQYAAGYPAEKADWAEKHPRPTFKGFLRAHATRHSTAVESMVCPECGATITPIPAPCADKAAA